MNPIKLLRKLGKVLRGGATFRQIFLGVLLGFAIGMTPGANLTLIILIALFLLLNINGAMGGLALLLGRGLCYLLAPVTFWLGYALIHNLGLIGLVRWMADTPVLALLDWHVYSLMGGIVFIIVLGGPMAWLAGRSIEKARESLAAAGDKSEAFRKLSNNKVMKIFLRIVFGKQKEDFGDMLNKKSPLFRKGRLIGGGVLLGVVIVLQWLFLGAIVERALVRGLEAANGAEVNVDSASLSLLTGRLEIRGLQVTDRQRPTHNSVQAGRIVADVSITGLLTRRLVVDVLSCEQMVLDAERTSPGEVYRTGDEPTGEFSLPAGLGDKAQYLAEINRTAERLQRLREYLESSDPATEADAEAQRQRLAEQARISGYLSLSAGEFLARHPTWVIRELTFQLDPAGPIPGFTVRGENLSSHPSLHTEAFSLKAEPDWDAFNSALREQGGGEFLPDGIDLPFGGGNGDDSDGPADGDEEDGGLLEGLLGR